MTARKTKTARTLNYNDATGSLIVTEGKATTIYTVTEIYPDAGYGGRGFEFRKWLATEDGIHHVHTGGVHGTTCDCRGFERWGNCKHGAAIEKLIALNLIADPRFNAEQDH